MSIINQMLQKLDQRRGGRDASLPEGVRAVASPAGGRKPVILGLLILILAGAGGAFAWLKWQQHQHPVDKKAVSAGKVPSAAAQPKVAPPAPKETVDEDRQLAEIAKQLMEESTRQAEKSGKADKSGRKADSSSAARKTVAGHETPRGASADVELGGVQESAPMISKKVSRESSGKIRGTEAAMKSVTPEQQALHVYQKSLALLSQGRVSEARSGLEDALKQDPFLLSARQALASLLVEQKQLQLAETVLREGVDLNPEQYGFAMALGRLQVERGDAKAALETLNRSLPFAQDNAGFQAFLAALLQRTEQHKKAIDHYQAALRLMNTPSWQIGLGISLQAENRSVEALKAFQAAKASNELNPELTAFVEQRIRVLKRTTPQEISEVKAP